MLRTVEISGFKTIRKEKLDLGRVNLFIGGNGSGKSNILEALGILSASLKDISDTELQKRGVRLSVPTLFKSAFKNTSLRSTLNLKATFDNNVRYDVSIKAGLNVEGLRFFSESLWHGPAKLMGRGQNGINVPGINVGKKDVDPTRGLWDRFRELINTPDEVLHELERMARFAIYAPQTAFLRGTEVESIPVQPMGLQGGGLAQAALTVSRLIAASPRSSKKRSLMQDVVKIIWEPGWTRHFQIRDFDPSNTTRLVKTGTSSLYFVDRFMTEGRNTLSAYDSSEGTLYLLFMAILLLHPTAPKIFALDNVDSSLNPAVTKKLIETLITCTCSEEFRTEGIGPDQIFLTSHNPTALDAIDIFDDQQRIFVVKRDETGATSVQRLKPPDDYSRADWIKLKKGRHLSELWIEGLIGGALGL